MERAFLRVQDNPDLVRERNSKAVLNTNQAELNKYKQIREEKMKCKSVLEEQQKMRADIDEIKSLLKQLVGRSD